MMISSSSSSNNTTTITTTTTTEGGSVNSSKENDNNNKTNNNKNTSSTMNTSSSSSKTSSSSSFQKNTNTNNTNTTTLNILMGIVSIFIGFILLRNRVYSNDKLIHMIPNFCLFTPFRSLTIWAWDTFLVYDTTRIIPEYIPEMDASEYTFERFEEMTDHFRIPGIVRGLFNNTVGTQRWSKSGYLSNIMGNVSIRAYKTGYYDQTPFDEIHTTFGTAVEEVINDPSSLLYLFFPIAPQAWIVNTSIDITNAPEAVNYIVQKDLDINRIFDGFGTLKHKGWRGSQLIIGQGRKKEGQGTTTGTYWHAGIINNWFIQVYGTKRWYFLDQEHSALLKPARLGAGYLASGPSFQIENEQYMPLKTALLHSGDLLYNPEWNWHRIENPQPGITIGVPIREFVLRRCFRNNIQYTTLAIIDGLLERIVGWKYPFTDHSNSNKNNGKQQPPPPPKQGKQEQPKEEEEEDQQ